MMTFVVLSTSHALVKCMLGMLVYIVNVFYWVCFFFCFHFQMDFFHETSECNWNDDDDQRTTDVNNFEHLVSIDHPQQFDGRFQNVHHISFTQTDESNLIAFDHHGHKEWCFALNYAQFQFNYCDCNCDIQTIFNCKIWRKSEVMNISIINTCRIVIRRLITTTLHHQFLCPFNCWAVSFYPLAIVHAYICKYSLWQSANHFCDQKKKQINNCSKKNVVFIPFLLLCRFDALPKAHQFVEELYKYGWWMIIWY